MTNRAPATTLMFFPRLLQARPAQWTHRWMTQNMVRAQLLATVIIQTRSWARPCEVISGVMSSTHHSLIRLISSTLARVSTPSIRKRATISRADYYRRKLFKSLSNSKKKEIATRISKHRTQALEPILISIIQTILPSARAWQKFARTGLWQSHKE